MKEAQSQGLKGTGTITPTPVQTNVSHCCNPEIKTMCEMNSCVHFLLRLCQQKGYCFSGCNLIL